jgi:hypothetical protein
MMEQIDKKTVTIQPDRKRLKQEDLLKKLLITIVAQLNFSSSPKCHHLKKEKGLAAQMVL